MNLEALEAPPASKAVHRMGVQSQKINFALSFYNLSSNTYSSRKYFLPLHLCVVRDVSCSLFSKHGGSLVFT